MAADTDARPVEPPRVHPRRRLGLVIGLAAAWIALDQLTKLWALHALDDRDIHIVWKLQLNLVHNPGSAFSLGRGLGPLLGVLAAAVSIFLLRLGKHSTRLVQSVALGLVLGGAVGNLIDRAFRSDSGFLGGKVIDFIDFQFWPVFNVADMGVTVGVALLLLDMTRAPKT